MRKLLLAVAVLGTLHSLWGVVLAEDDEVFEPERILCPKYSAKCGANIWQRCCALGEDCVDGTCQCSMNSNSNCDEMCKNIPKHGPCCVPGPKPKGGCHCCGNTEICTDNGCRPSCAATCKGDGKGGIPCCKGEECQICNANTQECSPTNGCQTKEVCQSDSTCDSWCKSLGVGGGCCKKTQRFNPGLCSCCHLGETCNPPAPHKQFGSKLLVNLTLDGGEEHTPFELALDLAADRGWGWGTPTGYGWGRCNCVRSLCEAHCGQYGKKGCCTRLPVKGDFHDFCVCCDDGANCNLDAMRCEDKCGEVTCTSPGEKCVDGKCMCDAILCQNIDKCHACGLLNTCDKLDCGACAFCNPNNGCLSLCNPATENCVGGTCKNKCDGVVCPMGSKCVGGLCQCDPATCGGGNKCQFCGTSGTCETKSCPVSTPCNPNSGQCFCTDSACSAQCNGQGVPCCTTDLTECKCCPTGWNCASSGGWGWKNRDDVASRNSSSVVRAGVCTDPCAGVTCPIPGDSCQDGVCKCDYKSCGKNDLCEACGSTGHCGPIECGECATCDPKVGCLFQCDRATQICNINTCQCDDVKCKLQQPCGICVSGSCQPRVCLDGTSCNPTSGLCECAETGGPCCKTDGTCSCCNPKQSCNPLGCVCDAAKCTATSCLQCGSDGVTWEGIKCGPCETCTLGNGCQSTCDATQKCDGTKCVDKCTDVVCPYGNSCVGGSCVCDNKKCGAEVGLKCNYCGSSGTCDVKTCPLDPGTKCDPNTGECVCYESDCQLKCNGVGAPCCNLDRSKCVCCPTGQSCADPRPLRKWWGAEYIGNSTSVERAGVCVCDPTTCAETCNGQCNDETQLCDSGCPGQCDENGQCPQSCEEQQCKADCTFSGHEDGCCSDVICNCCKRGTASCSSGIFSCDAPPSCYVGSCNAANCERCNFESGKCEPMKCPSGLTCDSRKGTCACNYNACATFCQGRGFPCCKADQTACNCCPGDTATCFFGVCGTAS